MKGVIFTEFLDMVETKFSADMVDDIIDDADLPSDGAYTAVGTYPHEEIVSLVASLSKASGLEVPVLIKIFGQHLFGRFYQLYPVFFLTGQDSFTFLESIENHIHVEVRKLYPDAQLPSFDTQRVGERKLIMTYRSTHPFADLADGLIAGCLAHFNTAANVTMDNRSSGATTHVEFHIERI